VGSRRSKREIALKRRLTTVSQGMESARLMIRSRKSGRPGEKDLIPGAGPGLRDGPGGRIGQKKEKERGDAVHLSPSWGKGEKKASS